MIDNRTYEVQWKIYFIGKDIVPANWEQWPVAELFFQVNHCMEIHEDFLNAGITHPHPMVVFTVGVTQKLSQAQLAFIFLRTDLSAPKLQQIAEAQQKMGVSYQTILLAMQMAEKVKKNSFTF